MSAVDFTRVFDILEYQQKKYPQQAALNFQDGEKWQSISISDVQTMVNNASAWLLNKGFIKGDCIAILPRMGNPWWMILDFACQQIGMITVPIHPTSTKEEIKFILNEVSPKICVTADDDLRTRVKEVFTAQHLYSFGGEASFHLSFYNNSYEGQNNSLKESGRLNLVNSITPEDTICIMYTSGTSGTPKGAVLSHENIVSNIKSILPLFPIEPGHRILSFLPFSHIFERTSCYAYLAFGGSIFFSRDLKELSNDFKTVKPFFITCVPKTLERMYEFLEEQCEQKNKLKRALVRWAMQVGQGYQERRSLAFNIKLFFARLLVLNAWRRALSSKIRYIIVGAAALRPEIGRLFSAAGVMTLSGYGMTEASPFITANRPEPGMKKFGTVGLPVAGVEVKLHELNENLEGEILVRGPNIMKGYFNRPDMNAEVFTDGWFHTGDIGKMVGKRFLAITGRKKDLFKTSAGIYIAPQELETYLISSPFISQCMVYGFNKPFVVAVLVPHFALLKNWCEENAIHWTSPQFMVHNIKVVQKYQQEIDQLNEPLSNYKKIEKFVLSDVEWTPETGELTTSLKMIRAKLFEKYQSEIEKLYSE